MVDLGEGFAVVWWFVNIECGGGSVFVVCCNVICIDAKGHQQHISVRSFISLSFCASSDWERISIPDFQFQSLRKEGMVDYVCRGNFCIKMTDGNSSLQLGRYLGFPLWKGLQIITITQRSRSSMTIDTSWGTWQAVPCHVNDLRDRIA